MLLKLLKAKGEYILLGDFNLYYPFQGGIIIINTDNVIDNLICAIKAASLNLAIKAGIETRVKGTSSSILDLVFTFP